MNNIYDLIIIGSGPGGYVAAARAGLLGLKTAIIEKDNMLGGTCLHKGCIPTKALLHVANIYEETKNSHKFGIITSDIKIQWNKIQEYKSKIIKNNALGVKHIISSRKVDIFHGFAQLINKNKISVEKNNLKNILKTKNIILAVGSKPKNFFLNKKISSDRILTSDTILNIKHIPKSLVIIGGGIIGCEFASIFSRFGTEVIIIENANRIIPFIDIDCSTEITKTFLKNKIKIITQVKINDLIENNNNVDIIYEQDKKSQVRNAEYVLIATGRIPATDNICLEKTLIQKNNNFIKTINNTQTHESNIYAIGDCINTPGLAHVASAEGITAVEQIAGLAPSMEINYNKIPMCIYSNPAIAWCGLNEEQIVNKNNIKISKFPFLKNGKSSILINSRGFIKIITNKKDGEILGVHIIGPNATELIAEPSFAIQIEATIDNIANTIHAHPSLYESIYEVASIAINRPLHG